MAEGTDCGGLIGIPPLVLRWGLFHAPCLFLSHTNAQAQGQHPHIPAFFSHCRLISASGNAVDQNLFLSSQPLLVDIYRDLFFSSVLGKMPTNIYSLTWELVFVFPSAAFIWIFCSDQCSQWGVVRVFLLSWQENHFLNWLSRIVGGLTLQTPWNFSLTTGIFILKVLLCYIMVKSSETTLPELNAALPLCDENNSICRTSLVVQRLRFCTSIAGSMGLIPGRGTKILHALWHGQKKKKIIVSACEDDCVISIHIVLGW